MGITMVVPVRWEPHKKDKDGGNQRYSLKAD